MRIKYSDLGSKRWKDWLHYLFEEGHFSCSSLDNVAVDSLADCVCLNHSICTRRGNSTVHTYVAKEKLKRENLHFK